jgi:hypothetical protein
METQTQP